MTSVQKLTTKLTIMDSGFVKGTVDNQTEKFAKSLKSTHICTKYYVFILIKAGFLGRHVLSRENSDF